MNIFKKNLYVIFINLIIVIFFIYILSKFIFLWLDIYTKHNRFIIVPDISNLDIKLAKQHLNNLGLYYEIDSSNYNPNILPYKVLTFSPKAGDIVKPGRTIFIQINSSIPNTKFTKLPNILFEKKNYALGILYSKNYIIRNITYIPNINSDILLKIIYNNKIINPGYILPYKSILDLVITIDKYNVVPNLYGMNFLEAKKLLEKKNFILTNIFYTEKNNINNLLEKNNINNLLEKNNINNLFVDHQEPVPGTKSYNNTIKLWIVTNSNIQKYNFKNKNEDNINQKNESVLN